MTSKCLDVDGRMIESFHGPWRYEGKKLSKTGYGWYVRLNVDFDRDKWNRRIGIQYLEALGHRVGELIDAAEGTKLEEFL